MISGYATAEATAAWAARFPQFAKTQHFRRLRVKAPLPVLQMSSIGIGTYLGEADAATDDSYAEAITAALDGGLNVIDTSINYRHQRSERVIGRVLASGRYQREELVLCTKAGYLPFDGELPADPRGWLVETYLRPGIAPPGLTVGGMHCISPVFLAHQLQRSLDNMGVDSVDIFYLHNPEEQQAQLSREEFYRRLRTAFEFLEKSASLGRIQYYGAATWNGFRVPPDEAGFLDLNRMVATAKEVAGENHRFRFIQLPYNLIMAEAQTLLNQTVDRPPFVSTLNACYRLGLHAVSSASLASGRLRGLSGEALDYLKGFLPGDPTPTEMALQFVRSTTSVTTALVGMSKRDHVVENLHAALTAPAAPAQLNRLLQQ